MSHSEQPEESRFGEESVIQGPWSAPQKQAARKSPWARRAAMFALMLVVLTIAAVIALRTQGGWQQAGVRMSELKPYFVAVHLGLIALLWWKWEAMVLWVTSRRGSSHQLRDVALQLRGRAIAMLLAIEVLVVLQWPFSWFR